MSYYEIKLVKPIEGCECGLMETVAEEIIHAKNYEMFMHKLGIIRASLDEDKKDAILIANKKEAVCIDD